MAKWQMERWQEDSVGSIYNYLSPGCRICSQGAGLVLFVTGRCERSCFYCPLSEERRGSDQVFADEMAVRKIDDILREASAIDALGTGITGGEPLLKLDYVLECIRALKQSRGPSHHIHLYTGLLPGRDVLQKLAQAGLDEIRFHPPLAQWSEPVGLREALQQAKSLGMVAGVEIPSIQPAPAIVEAVKAADAFLNANELEFSETNYAGLAAAGFIPEDLGCAASGSREVAREHFLKDDIRAHFCPSRFKDAVQLKERLLRRAKKTARLFDYVSEEGTIIHGVIEGDLQAARLVLEVNAVPEEMYSCREGRIEIAACILEDITSELKGVSCVLSIIEKYPFEDGMVVDRIPL
ncbi:MAG: molybdenum cofactor biosynthesis protein A [Methanosaeta sp. PtaU1.Bin112]|nr:MAG: molybdenum cofactor biosynthesis protein A [Methanosaeta sp. PtaU1.Bin112]